MTMTHTANAEPRLPSDYTTPPAAPVREYRMTPEEAARYPAVRPTRQDFSDATEAGWTPDRFAATYGRDAKHTDILRRAFRSILDARDMRRRRGEDEDERTPVERSGPAVTTSEWIARIKVVLREHPDRSRQQLADGLGTTTGVINNAMVRTGSNLTELRARVQRELAEAADNAAGTGDKNTEVDDVANRTGLNLTAEAIKQVLTEHRDWTGARIAAEFGLTHKQFENWCTRNSISLREIRKQILLSAFAAPEPPTAPEPAPAGRETDIPVVCRGCGATAAKATETLHHNPSCPLVAPDALAEAPPQPADVPPPAPDDGGPTCPICHRAVADCNHEGDCERSGRHEVEGCNVEPSPSEPEAPVTVNRHRVICARCGGEMRLDGAWYRCPECDAPEAPGDPEMHRAMAVAAFSPDDLPTAVKHPAAMSVCATCVKSDVCRHLPSLAGWIERAQLPDVDLDIELDIVVRRCEAYRGEGAA